MAVERFNLAFAGPITHAGSPAVTDRSGIQSLLKAAQEVAEDLGIKSRHILVLNALASFVREFTSDNRPIVFASNEALSRRCCAMPVPTLQRTLRQLVDLGFIGRNLSPNGKRYTHRDSQGRIIEAYGIDLSPLIRRAEEVHELLEQHRRRVGRISLLRDRLSLCRQRFSEDAPEQLLIKAALRRKHKREDDLVAILDQLDPAVHLAGPVTGVNQNAEVDAPEHRVTSPGASASRPNSSSETRDLTSNDHQSDTHYQSSNPRIYESEEKLGKQEEPVEAPDDELATRIAPTEVNKVCQEALQFAPAEPRSWHDLVELALLLAPMIGITEGLAKRAMASFGLHGFALTVLCLVQKFGHIRSPAAYLSRLLAPQGQAYSPSRFFRSLCRPKGNPGSAGVCLADAKI